MKRWKRGLSLLLAMVMIISLLPTSALAAGYDKGTNQISEGGPVKQVTLHAKPKDTNGLVGINGATAAATATLIVPMNMPVTIAAGNSAEGTAHDYKFTGWQLDSRSPSLPPA